MSSYILIRNGTEKPDVIISMGENNIKKYWDSLPIINNTSFKKLHSNNDTIYYIKYFIKNNLENVIIKAINKDNIYDINFEIIEPVVYE